LEVPPIVNEVNWVNTVKTSPEIGGIPAWLPGAGNDARVPGGLRAWGFSLFL